MNDREAIFVESFVQRGRRERVLYELGSSKKRQDFFEKLCHNFLEILEPKFMLPIERAYSEPEDIYSLLRGRGAQGSGSILSFYSELDGLEMPLDEALKQVVGRGFPSIICCLQGRLAYFEAEQVAGPPPRYILARP